MISVKNCRLIDMLLFALLLTTTLWHDADLILVKIEQGTLRGELRNRSTGNGQLYSFKGIPYAAPPIGKLRFKAPQPPLPFKGVRNATTHGAMCVQTDITNGTYLSGDEDCLFLNIYTPTLKLNASLAVMFFIHGGSLITGSGNEDHYGPAFLLDHNVVLITINYRLGALGFLCLDIKEVPGNAGLKDQVAALRWVKKNIHKFGGDPDNVTIFGQDAGAVSVSLHASSPMSKGLFKRGIIMSSVFLNDFYLPFEPKRQGLLLAHKIGMYTKDSYAAFRFLQNATAKAVIVTKAPVLAFDKIQEDIIKYHAFAPVVEKDFGGEHFMVRDPEKLLRDGNTNDIDLIIGHTAKEGVTRAASQEEYVLDIFAYFAEVLVPSKIGKYVSSKTVLKLSDEIHQHYFGDKAINRKTMKEFINLHSYLVYVYDIHRYLEMWTKRGNKAYFYEFSCFSERNIYGKTGIQFGVKKASHNDDLMYIFDGLALNLTLNKTLPSYKMILQTCTLLTNFAKYGRLRALMKIMTIFGQDAGAVSVSLHALSPMSKGLFKRGIIMSSVFLNDFYLPFEPKRQGLLLAHKIGMYTKDSYAAFRFLQNATAKAVIVTKAPVLAFDKIQEDIIKYHAFAPVVEKDFGGKHFMVRDPEKLLKDGNTNDIDLIIGHTAKEGVTRAASQEEYVLDIFAYFAEILVPSKIGKYVSSKTVLKLSDEIHQHYFGDKAINRKTMKEFINLHSYLVYVYDIHRYLEMWTKRGNKAYFYEFSCFSERNIFGKTGIQFGVKKASHNDDLMYIFDGLALNVTLNKTLPSYKMILQTCTLLTNFAKYGQPTPNKSLGTQWLDYSKNKSYLNIDLELKLEKADLTEVNFWRGIFKKVCRFFS